MAPASRTPQARMVHRRRLRSCGVQQIQEYALTILVGQEAFRVMFYTIALLIRALACSRVEENTVQAFGFSGFEPVDAQVLDLLVDAPHFESYPEEVLQGNGVELLLVFHPES